MLGKNDIELVVTTIRKISILCSHDEAIPEFSLILNLGFHRDPEHYCKIHGFIAKKGTIFIHLGGVSISFPNDPHDLQPIEKATSIHFEEISAELTPQN